MTYIGIQVLAFGKNTNFDCDIQQQQKIIIKLNNLV